jgi:hypothetical protein
MRIAFALVGVVGCSYTPGSFAGVNQSFPGQHTTVGCLDVAVHRRPDMASIGPATGPLDKVPVIEYQFGNRCDDAVAVDLARVPVIGRTLAGEELTLTPFDPNFEIFETKLAARTAGGEALAYPTTEPLAQICVDAAGLTKRTTSETRWMCFATPTPPEPVRPEPIDEGEGYEEGAKLEHEEVRS